MVEIGLGLFFGGALALFVCLIMQKKVGYGGKFAVHAIVLSLSGGFIAINESPFLNLGFLGLAGDIAWIGAAIEINMIKKMVKKKNHYWKPRGSK